MTLTYREYLRLDGLLAQQQPKSNDHDEMLFIVIHQVYELWFKQCVHELRFLAAQMTAGDLPRALHTLKRVLTILKTMVAQLDILETMTPLSFLSFRDRLETASGFQSAQFREFEFLCGHKQESALQRFPPGTPDHARLQRAFREPTVFDAFLTMLPPRGFPTPAEIAGRDVTRSIEPCPALRPVLVRVYREDPLLAALCERLVDFDEGLQEWRYRHVKMVERTIGEKPGTGGSSGVEYLRGTLFRPLFPDLWAVRAML